jgi:type II secretory pathway pseudopilin PulG
MMSPIKLRVGFTLMETVVALGCLLMAATLVAQIAVWSMTERVHADARLAAMEWAANVLETARAKTWADLTPEWAASQTLPTDLTERMLQPTAAVVVTSEKDRPHLKRVSVTVRWFIADGAKAAPVELMTLFAERQKADEP